MKKDRKKVIWVGIIVLWFCALMIINREKLDIFLSNTFAIQEENPEILIYSDEIPIDGITAEREIIQPLTFSRRVGHIGVKIGTYGRENHSIYEISLVDQWGNVLGMAKEDAANIKDNEYYYIKIERLIIPGQEYYLKISSDSADEENAITCYVSRSIPDQKHVIINGVEQDYSLIMTFMYGKVNNYTSSIAVILLFIYMIYAGYKIADGYKYCLKFKDIALSKRMHQIILAVFLICFLIAVFNKSTVYKILYTGGEYNGDVHVSEALLDNVTIEETFVYPEDRMNCIEVKFALFLQTFQSGIIHFELYESGNPIQIREGVINAINIKRENINFSFPEIKDSKNKEYTLKIYTTEVSSDNAMSVFYTSDNTNENVFKMNGDRLQGDLIFTAGIIQKEFNLKLIFVFVVILVGSVLFYLLRFNEEKRKFVTVAGILFIGCIGGISLKTYSIYHQFSIDGLIKVLMSNSVGEERIYDQGNKFYNETFSRHLRTDGSVYGMMQMIELSNVNTKIDTILIKLEDDSTDKRSYNLTVFFDTGDGYNNNEKYNIVYVYHGESEILIYVPYRNMVRSVRIDIGKELHMANIEWNEQIVNIDQININKAEIKEVYTYFYILVTIIFILLLMFYLISGKLKDSAEVIQNSFLVMGIMFGIIMSVLIPIAQIPDEDYHVKRTLCSIGGDDIYKQIQNINREIGLYQILGYSGEKVDILKYQNLLTTQLESYQLSNIIEKDTLEILKRPGQTIGILIAIFFKMPVFWIYFLGEIGGLLVYIGICFYVLKLLPNKRELMCMIMLLPMSLQQGGSFSYDSFNNALSFLLVAYIIYLKLRKKCITLKDVIVVLSIGLLLFYIKTIYAGLLLLFAIIPIEQYHITIGKYHIDKQWIKANIKKIVIVIIVGIILSVCLLVITRYEYTVLFSQIITNFGEVFRLVIRSFIEQGNMYIHTMIANFGWADTFVSELFLCFYLFATIWLCLSNDNCMERNTNCKECTKSKIVERSIIILTITLMLLIVMFSMINGTFNGQAISKSIPVANKLKLLNVITGIQGRYFIPVLPLLLFTPGKVKQFANINKTVFMIMTESISIVYIIWILLQRYWI